MELLMDVTEKAISYTHPMFKLINDRLMALLR